MYDMHEHVHICNTRTQRDIASAIILLKQLLCDIRQRQTDVKHQLPATVKHHKQVQDKDVKLRKGGNR